MGTRSLVAAALLTFVALPLAAQGRPQTREGFWIGFGVGYGSLGCEDCSERTGAVSGYLKGGAGFATVEGVAFGFSETEVGGGLMLGLGFDARVARNFSLTPYVNLMGGSFEGGNTINLIQFGLGFSWH